MQSGCELDTKVAEAETAPLAVCLAFLKAKKVSVENEKDPA